MKKIFSLILFLAFFIMAQGAFASRIPDGELEILKKTFPDVNIRFDGLVELSDGTSYIPVFPVNVKKEAIKAEVVKTIPANKALKDKPDFVMFNTNFALFKIIQDKDKKTVIYNSDIPYEAKMGIFPQDLLVPTGFQIPEELRIIIGDLLIPVKPTTDYKEVAIKSDSVSVPTAKLVSQAAQQLSNKYFYATSFNSNALTILNADTGKAFKEIDFTSIPSDIKLTNDGRYLLLTTIRNENVYVVDTVKTKVLKELQVGKKPFFIAVSEPEDLAYVANRGENKISVLNIRTMQPEDDIMVTGNPCYISLSEDGQKMYYLDSISGTVYYLEKLDNYFKPYSANPLFRANNISKIQVADDKIYTLDRAESKLAVYYLNGKSEEQLEQLVNVSDITPVKPKKNIEPAEVNAVDYNYYNETEEAVPFDDVPKEKITFKQRARKAFRALLYYPEDDEVQEQPENPDNKVVVFNAPEARVLNVELKDAEGILYHDSVIAETDVKKQKETKEEGVKKTFKEKWFDFLNYKAPQKPLNEVETIKMQVDRQMDFVDVPNRANDFIVINNKVYVLCSDDYVVYVYDKDTNAQINSFELDRNGYYNALKVSTDKKVGIITNISSHAITLFDTQTDAVIQRLPISANVHNVVITSRK